MLLELAVRDLGVIDELTLVLGPGMTAVTGETGAGKTLVVQAIDLLTGGRADPSVVRVGAAEAVVEGRFELDGDEVVLRRVVPASGRSRAYVDGSMATAAALGEIGARLVDLHGQHAHQSLLAAAVQRDALDRHAGIALGPLRALLAELADVTTRLAELGGDQRSRSHELDLLRFQLDEIDGAGLDDDDEEGVLERVEDELAGAAAHLEAAATAHQHLGGDGGSADGLGDALAALAGRGPFAELADRLRTVAAEVDDIVVELRLTDERIEDDPERLAEVRARRQLIRDLCRKYGDTVAEVRAFGDEARERRDQLERHDEIASELERTAATVRSAIADAEAEVASARRLGAPRLSSAVTGHLAELALPRAEIVVTVDGDGPADDVAFAFDANGEGATQPLTKVASGGELARVMLALRLVLTAGPPTLVFDEVDAGIGGAAASAVGAALAQLTDAHQVVVVTHLPQVAACADHHVVVTKRDDADGRVRSEVAAIAGDERVTELARMLSGRPESASGREHAGELLAAAGASRRVGTG